METETKLMQGNEACVAGALHAGMRFFAGYPITPSTEIAELSALHLPKYGGKFIQMEDELASMAAAIGASIAGEKAMTATSGPGFSLKQENLGYAAMAEIPCVIVNVQRCGPSTGLPTSPAQGDVMQARWGTHGDHPMIVLTPSSVSETFSLTVQAFNLAEQFMTPVILLMDEVVGHMREKVNIKELSQLPQINRRRFEGEPDEYFAYRPDQSLTPALMPFGEGYRYHITGLYHDETGFPTNSTDNARAQLKRLHQKLELGDNLAMYEEVEMDKEVDLMILSYGSTYRSARKAARQARKEGKSIGEFRVVSLWPSPELAIREAAKKAKAVLVVEMNEGQYVQEVERIVKGESEIHFLGNGAGELINPEEVYEKILEVLSCQANS
jgi:2-oxoglutarate ferredoxin oxidoreductase subunit alpha